MLCAAGIKKSRIVRIARLTLFHQFCIYFLRRNYVFGEQNMIFQWGYLALLCPEACLAEDSSLLLRKVTSMNKAHVELLFCLCYDKSEMQLQVGISIMWIPQRIQMRILVFILPFVCSILFSIRHQI
jgi:hypothetical protein